MNEGQFRRSTNPHRSARKPAAKTTGPGVIGVQTVLCLICLLLAFLIKFAGGGIYASAKKLAGSVLSQNITMTEVRQAFGNIRKNLPDAVSVFDDLNGTGSSLVSTGTNSSVSSQKTDSSDSASSSSGQTDSGKTDSASSGSSVSSGGTGGSDLNAPGKAANAAVLTAPKKVTLAPVVLTVKPIYPVKGRITSKFGYRISPITGKLSFHTGVDIAAATGTSIHAALPGTVEKVGKSDSYGNYIMLNNNGGVVTFYAHCSKIVASEGQKVKAGDVIAKVGSTGNSTGPHCHFEIRVNGIFINPLAQLET